MCKISVQSGDEFIALLKEQVAAVDKDAFARTIQDGGYHIYNASWNRAWQLERQPGSICFHLATEFN